MIGAVSTPSIAGEQLVRRASELLRQGSTDDAARLLRQAADLHRKAKRRYDEARCRTLLAQCLRMLDDLPAASTEIARAVRLSSGHARAELPALAERVEILIAQGDAAAAAAGLDDVLARCRELGESGRALLAALLRRRAAVLGGALGRRRDAAADLAEAAAVLTDLGQHGEARRALVERATAMHEDGGADVEQARAEARAAVDAAGDRALAGELDMLAGAVAVGAGRLDEAEGFSRSARDHALAAVAPTTYVGASVALSELADIRGDRVAAYEALAVGCATMGDLIGRDGADAVYEPRFEGLREQWGVADFDQTRAAYEDRRRAALGR